MSCSFIARELTGNQILGSIPSGSKTTKFFGSLIQCLIAFELPRRNDFRPMLEAYPQRYFTNATDIYMRPQSPYFNASLPVVLKSSIDV